MNKPQNSSIVIALRLAIIVIFCTLPALANAHVRFYNINETFGISVRETASTRVDGNGFVWVSSKTGILRLTDDDYRIYQLPYETWNVITVKLEYQNSELIACTNNGQLFLYNKIQDRFDLIVNLASELNNPFLTINNKVIDGKGRIWLSSSFGLIMYEKGDIRLFNELGEVFYVAWYGENRIILAAANNLVLFNTETEKIDPSFAGVEGLEQINVSKLLLVEPTRDLWIGTESTGIFVFNTLSKTLKRVDGIPRQPVLALKAITDSTIMAGVDGQGLWEINKSNLKIANVFKEDVGNPNSLRGNGVYDIYKAPDGRVWVCTYSGGVSYFEKSPELVTQLLHIPNEENSLVNNDVNDILEDRRGNLWFATNNGVSRLDTESGKWQAFYHNVQEEARVFLTLSEDSRGNIWAGTFSSGVYVIDGETKLEIAHFVTDGANTPFTNNFVFDILDDQNGNIWIAGVMGDLYRYNEQTQRFSSFGNHPVYAIKQFSDNEMLLGCTYGLSILNIETGVVEIVLTWYLVHDFLVMDNFIWLATSGDGLVKFNIYTREVAKYNTEFGLPSNFVNSITASDGYLWLGTEGGISRFCLTETSIENFPEIKNLSGVSFNRNAHFTRDNGQLMWGTNRGAIIFNPSDIIQNQPEGKIFLQDILVLGKSIRNNIDFTLDFPVNNLDKLELKPNQNTLSLEMIPLGMSGGANFSWMLYGFDQDWSQPTSIRNLNYTNIPPGDYILKIRMWNNSMLNIIDERHIHLTQLPPFWKTWWFLSIVTVFVIISILLALKYYIGLINQAHSEDKVRFFANTAHEIRTSLTLIKAPIDELTNEDGLTDSGKYYLNLAKDQVNRLVASVTNLLDFQKIDIGKERLTLTEVDVIQLVINRLVTFEPVAAEKNLELRFKEEVGLWISAVDIGLIEKIVDNVISNAIKYSKPGGIVEITFSTQGQNWILEVQDYGIGISKIAQRQIFKEFYRGENAINAKIGGSGIGLLLSKKYVSLHGGQIRVTSRIGKGTRFRISIPSYKTGTAVNDTMQGPNIDPDKAVSSPPEILQKHLSTVLVAEDNYELRSFLKHTLQNDFKIILTEDGEQAWEVIKNQIPDLVISDVMMPKRDGFELCRLIKSTYETSHIPVILLTALSDKTDHLKGLGEGADDYITKPFDTVLLRQRIKSIITNRIAIRDKALKIISRSDNEAILINVHNDKFLKRALKVVQANIANTDFGKDKFASEMNVSASLLYKKIKCLTNQSPTDFIKSVRLIASLELLQKKNHTITEVSELCGFSSVGYFSTVFRKHFGKTPSEAMEGQN